MANTEVILKHSDINGGSPIQVYCTSVIVGLNKKNDKTPNANYDQYPADVQTTGRDNIKYTLQNAKIDVGDLSYDVLLEIFNLVHDEADPLIMNVKYNNKYLVDGLSSTTDIPVTMDGSSTVTFSTTDSKDSYMPTVTIPLIEVS